MMGLETKNLTKASLFLSLGLIFPYIFHLTGMAGTVFLPMHIPVLLCGFILGERYGLLVGFITPLLNSLLTGMPPIYPTGVSMALELATYGFITGYLYKNKDMHIVISLVIAMVLGRVVSGASNYLLLTMGGKPYTFEIFLASAFIKAIWGIVLQLAFIPVIVKSIDNKRTTGIN